MDTKPAAMSAMNIGMKNGLILLAPRSRYWSCCSSKLLRPPMPLPRITPVRSESSPLNTSPSPASVIAWKALAMAYCEY